MNANKLADDLDNANGFQYIAQLGLASQAATMLRQQQVEIEALKEKVKQNADLNEKVYLCKKKLKPIVWMAEVEGGTMYTNYEYPESIPLYTHPVSQYKAITNTKIEPTVVSYTHPVELTDEEIFNLEQQAYNLSMQVQNQKAEIEALKADKALHDEAYLSQMKEIEALKKEAALQRLSDFTQEAEHDPVGYFIKNYDGEWVEAKAEYWDEAIPLYTHPVKELHLSLQKSKQTGELLAVTYTDDEHRIVEVLWQRPPVKELTDEEIKALWKPMPDTKTYESDVLKFARAIMKRCGIISGTDK